VSVDIANFAKKPWNSAPSTIIKRDGREEPYQREKLDKVLHWVTDGDEAQKEILLRDTEVTLKPVVKVKELYDSIIECYNSATVAPRANILKYFQKFQLKNLMNQIDNF
jgi:hypothetical protein